MSEWNEAKRILSGNLGLHVIDFPSGKFGYVGSVPVELYYVDGATEEQIMNAEKFGGRFGPKCRVFNTREEAIQFAVERGFNIAS